MVLDVHRGHAADSRFLALVDEVCQTAFGVLSSLDAGGVGKGESLFLLVEVDEVALGHVAHAFDYTVGIVFGNCNAIQFHNFGSTKCC